MKMQVLCGLLGVIVLSSSSAAFAGDYTTTNFKPTSYCRNCNVDIKAIATLKKRRFCGLIVERAKNVHVYKNIDKGAHTGYLFDKDTTNFSYGPSKAAVMAAIVGVYAYQHRDDVALVAKNAANGTRKLIKETSHNVNAFIQSKL